MVTFASVDWDERRLRPWRRAASQFAVAIATGEEFFAATTTTTGTPDYPDYLRAVLTALGVAATPGLLAELQRPVEPAVFLETFPEVPATLRELRRRGVRLAVVSDAWAELPELHAGLGIHVFFKAYAISALVGTRKPDPRRYRHASDALRLEPGQRVFVDDEPDNVTGAIDLGYVARPICRNSDPPGHLPSITSLTELLELF